MKRYGNDIGRPTRQNPDKGFDIQKNLDERFSLDLLVKKKDSFEDNNKIINELNEDIATLKKKMTFVFEKDEEIMKLKQKVIELNHLLSNSENDNKKLVKTQKELDILRKKIQSDQINLMKLDKLETENSFMKKQLIDMHNKLNSSSTECEIDIDDKEEETIHINIDKLKVILNDKIKHLHDKRVDKLLNKYDIKDNSNIETKKVREMLECII